MLAACTGLTLTSGPGLSQGSVSRRQQIIFYVFIKTRTEANIHRRCLFSTHKTLQIKETKRIHREQQSRECSLKRETLPVQSRMSQRLSNEIIIDGKLMNIGKSRPGAAWPDQPFQINAGYGQEGGPADPGSEEARRVKPGSDLEQGSDGGRRASNSSVSLKTTAENEIFSRSLEPDQTETHRLSPSVSNKAKQALRVLAIIVLVGAYNAYIAYALHFHLNTGRDMDWCGGLGFLIIITALVYFSLFYFHILKKIVNWRKIRGLLPLHLLRVFNSKTGNLVLNVLVIVVIGVFLVIDTQTDRKRLISAGGILVIIALGTLFSKSRKNIVWRHVREGVQKKYGLFLIF